MPLDLARREGDREEAEEAPGSLLTRTVILSGETLTLVTSFNPDVPLEAPLHTQPYGAERFGAQTRGDTAASSGRTAGAPLDPALPDSAPWAPAPLMHPGPRGASQQVQEPRWPCPGGSEAESALALQEQPA